MFHIDMWIYVHCAYHIKCESTALYKRTIQLCFKKIILVSCMIGFIHARDNEKQSYYGIGSKHLRVLSTILEP